MTVSLDPAAPHHLPALIWGGFAEIMSGSISVVAEPALPPEEPTRNRLDEEVVRLETMREAMRDDRARREVDFAIGRLEQVKTTLSF